MAHEEGRRPGRPLLCVSGARTTSERAVNVLTLSTLYPNREMPYHGVFVENRLRHLIEGGDVAALVVAPVPWFPLESRRFGHYARFARVPPEERRHGITVLHPRYASVPKIGMSAAPFLMYRSLKTYLHAILRERFAFDVVDAHYFYPDGVAAALLGRSLGKPVVITARGTDVNLIPDHRLPRRWIRWAAGRAAGIVAVSEALRARLVELGVAGARIEVLRNGVDLDLFAPRDRQAARREAGLDADAAIVLSVGSLIPLKRHDLVIRALLELPEAVLVIVGEGPDGGRLQRLAGRLGLSTRVRFLGATPPERLAALYNAADVAVLASSREGFPNVLLEALACGTPVVATAVGGTPEIVVAPIAGRLVETPTPEALGVSIRGILADPPAPGAIRAYAERFGWGPTTAGQLRLFRSVVTRPE
jgi:teichuronic acid biosynthesis glycosyltransferase TuaC